MKQHDGPSRAGMQSLCVGLGTGVGALALWAGLLLPPQETVNLEGRGPGTALPQEVERILHSLHHNPCL